MADSDPVPVSADDTDGLEGPVVDDFSATELVLIGLVAAAVLAEIKGAASERFTRLNVFRKRVRGTVGGLMRRTVGSVGEVEGAAVEVGRRTAVEALQAIVRRFGADRSGRRPTPADMPTRVLPQPGAATPNTPRQASTPPHAAPRGNIPDLGQHSVIDLDAPRGGPPSHWAPDAEPDLTLAGLRATAPIAPRTPAGVTVRTPAALLPHLQDMAPQLVAATEGLYQQVMSEVLANPVTSEADRLRLAQKLLNRYAADGITGFVDSRGRRWSMTTYVEMATRTAAAQSAIDAHVALVVSYGYDLLKVSVHPNCAPQCVPFQGNLLSATGATSKRGPESWRKRIVATLANARARGLHHINCRHAVSIWIPGDPLPAAPKVDPADYKATQKLRYLERQVRASKRRRAAAMTPHAATEANAKTRALQTRIREHLATNPSIPRIRRREQTGIAR